MQYLNELSDREKQDFRRPEASPVITLAIAFKLAENFDCLFRLLEREEELRLKGSPAKDFQKGAIARLSRRVRLESLLYGR